MNDVLSAFESQWEERRRKRDRWLDWAGYLSIVLSHLFLVIGIQAYEKRTVPLQTSFAYFSELALIHSICFAGLALALSVRVWKEKFQRMLVAVLLFAPVIGLSTIDWFLPFGLPNFFLAVFLSAFLTARWLSVGIAHQGTKKPAVGPPRILHLLIAAFIVAWLLVSVKQYANFPKEEMLFLMFAGLQAILTVVLLRLWVTRVPKLITLLLGVITLSGLWTVNYLMLFGSWDKEAVSIWTGQTTLYGLQLLLFGWVLHRMGYRIVTEREMVESESRELQHSWL